MKLLSLTLILATAVQSISACGRIYGAMGNMIAADYYNAIMFDGCTDRCKGTTTGAGYSYDSVVGIPCNSGYKLQMTHNGHEAYYTTPWGKFDISFTASFNKYECGTIRDHTKVYCTSYDYDCWAFANNCNGCGGYKEGISKKCNSWPGMKRGLPEKDPNPDYIYNKTIVTEMIKNGTLKLSGAALEVHRAQNNGRLLSNHNLTAIHEKYSRSLM